MADCSTCRVHVPATQRTYLQRVSSEALNPDPVPPIETSPDPGQSPQTGITQSGEEALAERLDRLERVLREELATQKHRADRAEAQLRAFGELDEQAEELVAAARTEATRLLTAARHERDAAAAEHAQASAALEAARKEAAELMRRARVTLPSAAAAPAASSLDEELLSALRDHVIDVGALQSEMVTETRKAVIKLIQAASQARGGAALRPVPSPNSGASSRERARS
jgi:hypothetical protein